MLTLSELYAQHVEYDALIKEAQAELDNIKKQILQQLDAQGLRSDNRDGYKCSVVCGYGSITDKERLAADFPTLNLQDYKKQGKPYTRVSVNRA